MNEVAAMNDAVLDGGWDGDWFVRAYDAQSNPIGSKSCEEGQIYIEPQGFFSHLIPDIMLNLVRFLLIHLDIKRMPVSSATTTHGSLVQRL